MPRWFRLVVCCIVMLPGAAFAQTLGADTQHEVLCELFVRTESEISAEAKRYAEGLAARTNGLRLVVHDVLKDQAQLTRLWKISRRFGHEKPVVPAFYCCNQLRFGFKNPTATGPLIENLFTADVYTRWTCPKCKQAKSFIAKLERRWPAIRFRIYEITNDASARARWQDLCRSTGRLPGLPTIDFAGQVMIGYQGDSITGAALRKFDPAGFPEWI